MSSPKGFSLIEILLAAALLSVVALVAVAHMTQAAGHADWARDRVFARQKALSIIAELRTSVSGLNRSSASDLDAFDDGVEVNPTLSIAVSKSDPDEPIEPDHLLSGNIMDDGQWRWLRRITVKPLPQQARNDMRQCTVRVYRMRKNDVLPGEMMAEVSTVMRSVGDAYVSSQVFDVYLLALENVPAWWVTMDATRPYVDAALQELENRTPGLKFRVHWITSLGYGRDEEYAPYTNEDRDSNANTPWTYLYPGAMPATELNRHYYLPGNMHGRMNLDGESKPAFMNGFAPREPFTDTNGNGRRDTGEPFSDSDADGAYEEGNESPYAFADQHNHCMRYPDAAARFANRVAAGTEEDDVPTWRLLLDRMNATPDRYKNAILINLHGELLPMPPTRNFSDAARDPQGHPGWRVVTHPERIHTRRVAGNDGASDAPRFRVHAWKASFPSGHEPLMTQEEPFVDANKNGTYDDGETFSDWNGDSAWSPGAPISITLDDGDFTASPNRATSPSILVERLPGGIDADASGAADPYVTLGPAPRYPEGFTDSNNDGIRQVAEAYFDLDGNGARDSHDPYQELDGDGAYSSVSETLVDENGNGRFDAARPAEVFTDENGNDRWDGEEPYWDRNNNGVRDGPSVASPPAWKPWVPSTWGNASLTGSYIATYGEPFLDLDGDGRWDAAENFLDSNDNGAHDGGFARGEMWYSIEYQSWPGRTVLHLHGTPLETPHFGARGLPSQWRLYDLDYVPCPTPASAAAGGNRFERDLASDGDVPKNTARWRVTLPLASVRLAFETTPGAGNGDAADRVIGLTTRIGSDLGTGAMWPSWYFPQNASTTYTWFYADPLAIPYSERHQMRGDPRHCPYEDTDRHGSTAPHGYNWYWDDLKNKAQDTRNVWLAFDGARMRQGWMGRSDHDVPRMLAWMRSALTKSESFYTSMAGFSFYYLSVGGDIGSDPANDHPNSVPVDGLPYGLEGNVFENTVLDSVGTQSIRGSRKFVRSNAGAKAGIRSGGYWWSKPFLGELFPDAAYASQWMVSGNLTAGSALSSSAYRLMRRSDIDATQIPLGTDMTPSIALTAQEGSTSFFNAGTTTKTFHHRSRAGTEGSLVEAGFELATNYSYPVPGRVAISRPFDIAASGDGGVGPEFAHTDTYPHYALSVVRRFYDHDSAGIGSGIVRVRSAAGDAGYVTINGLDKGTENGSAFLARYSVLALVQSVFEAGMPGGLNRVRQLPRTEVVYPTSSDELANPATITMRWNTSWSRWDGRKYSDAYPDDFAEDAGDLAYVLMYSRNGGDSWLNMLDESKIEPGEIPWIEGVGPDPMKTRTDIDPDADESWIWSTPAEQFPQGSYLVRIEAHRKNVRRHYAFHMEKIHVAR